MCPHFWGHKSGQVGAQVAGSGRPGLRAWCAVAGHRIAPGSTQAGGFCAFLCGFSSHPCSKKLGTLGTNRKNARKSLSALNKTVPKTTGDKSFFTGDTGDSQFQRRSVTSGHSCRLETLPLFRQKKAQHAAGLLGCFVASISLQPPPRLTCRHRDIVASR